ncbi:MAG: hypothetical protein OER77_08710 [Myxococcales bacterium]|nr:hypothetical protein [Myxococcales bacterium]
MAPKEGAKRMPAITVRVPRDSQPFAIPGTDRAVFGDIILDSDRYARSRKWLTAAPLAVETGALNEDNHDVSKYINEVERLADRVQLAAVDIDLTLTKILRRTSLGWSPRKVAEKVAPFYRACERLGVDPRPMEAIHRLDVSGELLPYLHRLVELGAKIPRITIDLDWDKVDRDEPRRRWWHRMRSADPAAAYRRRFENGILALRNWCTGNGTDLAVILGSPMLARFEKTPGGFVSCVRYQRDRVGFVILDAYTIECWEPIPSKARRVFPGEQAFRDAARAASDPR